MMGWDKTRGIHRENVFCVLYMSGYQRSSRQTG